MSMFEISGFRGNPEREFSYFIYLLLCSADVLSDGRLHSRGRSEILFGGGGFCRVDDVHVRNFGFQRQS